MADQLLGMAVGHPARRRRFALCGGASLVMILALGLGEAAAAQQVEEVVVTGSRIRGINPVGSAVVGLNRDDIVATGAPSTGDLLRELPLIVALGANETQNAQNFAQNGAANLTRATSVNLRGLGPTATLLLLNGRRMPAAGLQGQITDASVIPSIVLERMEVVADGGSAIYGSDAVAGVVNMIPRTRFVGQESTARYGFADGYSDWQVAHLAGFKWNTGRLVAAGSYAEHTELLGADRDYYQQDLRARGGSDFRVLTCRPGTITPAGSTTTYAIPAGGVTSANAATLVPGSRNLCDTLPTTQILAPLKRTSLFGSAEQQLAPGVTLFADAFWSRRTFTQKDGSAGGTFTITPANPFYPVGLPGVVGTPNLNVQYDLYPETGPITVPGYSESWQTVLGFRAALPAAWQVEVYGSYGESRDGIDRPNTQVDSGALGARGFGGSSDPAVAFNPFGGRNNPATLRAGRSFAISVYGQTKLSVASAHVDGPLFELGGGAARLALGGEYRKEELSGLTKIGPAGGTPSPYAGVRDVWAGFTEVFLPFVGKPNAIPGVERLDLSLAARYEKYSDFGDTLNPKIGLVWTPFSAIDVRGSWGRSFRAPGLDEVNPKSSGYGIYGNDILPCNHVPGQATCAGISIVGGNANLKPEKAKTWSAGVEIHPESLKGLRASLSYFDINYTNQILALRGTTGLLTNPVYARYRTLNPTPAQVAALLAQGLPINIPLTPNPTFIQDGRRQNLGSTLASGIDFDASQMFDVGSGTVTVGLQGTYFTRLETSIAPGAALVDVRNLINYPQKFRARGTIGWRSGPFNARVSVDHVGAYYQQRVPTVVKIDSWTTVDLDFRYDVPATGGLAGGVSLGLNVSNAFDADPPFVNQSGAYDPQSATATGRLIAVNLRKRW